VPYIYRVQQASGALVEILTVIRSEKASNEIEEMPINLTMTCAIFFLSHARARAFLDTIGDDIRFGDGRVIQYYAGSGKKRERGIYDNNGREEKRGGTCKERRPKCMND
jgi:hypothetical protein